MIYWLRWTCWASCFSCLMIKQFLGGIMIVSVCTLRISMIYACIEAILEDLLALHNFHRVRLSGCRLLLTMINIMRDKSSENLLFMYQNMIIISPFSSFLNKAPETPFLSFTSEQIRIHYCRLRVCRRK